MNQLALIQLSKAFRSAAQQITEYYTEERYPFLDASELNPKEISVALKEVQKLKEKVLKET